VVQSIRRRSHDPAGHVSIAQFGLSAIQRTLARQRPRYRAFQGTIRQTNVEKLWILWADRAEIKRFGKLRRANWRGILGKPSELTTPKLRPKAT